ncbi:hypothetical protein ACPPVS_13705 [Cellulomonas sp. McL0617]|uniref:hypothetical protein n=1 Tax=Cellulomonas sp. McL0617 TaxID=3415675 RepID=UPI003CEE5822
MSGRWGWLGAAVVAGLVIALLFVVRTGSCAAAADGPDQTATCTTEPMLGNGPTWTFAVLIGLFVGWCLVHLVAPRR